MCHARPKHKISIAHVYMETLENSTESREELNKARVYKKLAYSTAYNGARIAHCCQGGAMNVAVTKERLTRFGLVSMLDYYTKRCVTC